MKISFVPIASLLGCVLATSGCGSTPAKPTPPPAPPPTSSAQPKPTQAAHEIGLAGYRFDPREYRRVLPAKLLRAEDHCAARDCSYLVQFDGGLDGATADELKAEHGLAFKAYVRNDAYLVQLTPAAAKAVCGHPRVRACMPHQPALAIPAQGTQGLRLVRDAIDSSDPQRSVLVATLFPNADVTTTQSELEAQGAEFVGATDDRKLGGVLRVQFRVADLETLHKVAFIESVQWIEVAPRIDMDG